MRSKKGEWSCLDVVYEMGKSCCRLGANNYIQELFMVPSMKQKLCSTRHLTLYS